MSIVLSMWLAIPIISVIMVAGTENAHLWSHLLATSLARYLINSLILIVLVGAGCAVIGFGCAWLVGMTDFPFRKTISYLLLAPLAVPAYIAAYADAQLFEYAGPIQQFIRDMAGFSSPTDYWFPQIRSIGGAVFILVFALYPYSYLMCRLGLREQIPRAYEAARALNAGGYKQFFRLGLPLARPAMVAGSALAMMEALADFGTVEHLAVPTLTVGVVSVWIEGHDIASAARIASLSFIIVVTLVWLERWGRRGARFHSLSTDSLPPAPRKLVSGQAAGALILCTIPPFFGFLLPAFYLLRLAFTEQETYSIDSYIEATINTVSLAAVSATLIMIIGAIIVYGARIASGKGPGFFSRLASFGYAIPGAVLAIGILAPSTTIDYFLAPYLDRLSGEQTSLLLTGSLAALFYAYATRFAAIPYNGLDAALDRTNPNLHSAARILGASPSKTLLRVQIPMIGSSIYSLWILLFVDITKELPATLLLRPFDFETLATLTFAKASLEQLEQAAPASLTVICIGLLPILLIALTEEHRTKGRGRLPPK